jgi:hypothetical protein
MPEQEQGNAIRDLDAAGKMIACSIYHHARRQKWASDIEKGLRCTVGEKLEEAHLDAQNTVIRGFCAISERLISTGNHGQGPGRTVRQIEAMLAILDRVE